MKYWKIRLGDRGYFTRIEIDGVEVRNAVGLKVEVASPSSAPTVTLTLLPETVEIEGDLEDAQIVGLLIGQPALDVLRPTQ